ncbi:MAG: hypothetical protein JWP74_3857 [Marmoricola sp.]|nr:hypothetical protein [Marmoricola sp.]
MTSVPNDPVSTPPKDTPSTDPSAPEPAEEGDDSQSDRTEKDLRQGREAALETEIPSERYGMTHPQPMNPDEDPTTSDFPEVPPDPSDHEPQVPDRD